MALVIGVDEAGYGPNLGPLAIGLSAWEVSLASSPRESHDLYELLRDVISCKADGERLAIADSKLLYQPGGGLALLERSVLAVLAAVDGRPPRCASTLINALGADPHARQQELPWHEPDANPRLPLDARLDDVHNAATRLLKAARRVGVRPVALSASLVHPAEFNGLIARHESKGRALSDLSLNLVRNAIAKLSPAPSPHPPSPIHIVCDKHGGRNHYAALLSGHFPDQLVTTLYESRESSRYRLFMGERRVEIEFRTNGEARLETALASMTAKYLRELAMRAFNDFWRRHLPDLKPTAGYPVDARRFKNDIAAKQAELGIDDHVLWRVR